MKIPWITMKTNHKSGKTITLKNIVNYSQVQIIASLAMVTCVQNHQHHIALKFDHRSSLYSISASCFPQLPKFCNVANRWQPRSNLTAYVAQLNSLQRSLGLTNITLFPYLQSLIHISADLYTTSFFMLALTFTFISIAMLCLLETQLSFHIL